MKTQKQRRIQRKTDYKARLGLLKSGLSRIAIRKTNKYIIVQLIKSNEARDTVEIGISSKNLLKHGWPEKSKGSLKSIPAAYLVGYLTGKEIVKKYPKSKVVLDLGLQRAVSGGKIYAALNGLVDSGIKISHNEKIFPKKERIQGKHLKNNVNGIVEKIKEKIDKDGR